MKKSLINTKKYKLSANNFYDVETEKTQIVIGSTFSNGMNHFNGWQTRLNGKNKKTAHYSVDINGYIFEHFNPKYYSNFVNNDDLNRKIVSVVIENSGWLLKDVEKNEFIDWKGNIYNGKVFEKKWRDFNYWIPYNDKQIESLIILIKSICNKIKNIPLEVISHNTKIDLGVNNYKGVLYRSNFNGLHTDPNPSLGFEQIKNIIELKEIENE